MAITTRAMASGLLALPQYSLTLLRFGLPRTTSGPPRITSAQVMSPTSGFVSNAQLLTSACGNTDQCATTVGNPGKVSPFLDLSIAGMFY